MFSHHSNLAQVWEHLQGRHDIASLVREIIGQHSIDTSLLERDNRTTQEKFRAIGWIKTIFDSQRCYLTGLSTGVAACPPYILSCLLSPPLLLSTLMYLIHVKTDLFSSRTTLMTRDLTRPRLVLAQTILSGFRLLLLHKEPLATNDLRRLQEAISQAWRDDRLFGAERFIVSDLFAEALNALEDPTRANPYQRERANAKLPMYAMGLYPLSMKVETFVTPLIHGTMEEDWIDAYWVLYDCLWAVECAISQRIVDLRRQADALGSNLISLDTDEILEQLWHTRTSLVISVFHVTGPMVPTQALLDSLAVTLLSWDDDLDTFLSRQDALLQQQRVPNLSGLNRVQNYSKQVSELGSYLDTSLTSFAEWLSSRKSGYAQFSTGRPSLTANNVQELVKEWVVKMAAPNTETLSKDGEAITLPVYIVDCPKLHAVSKKRLEHKLRWCDRFALEAVQGNSPIVHWKESLQCPSCASGGKIKTARLVEPFRSLTAALESLHSDEYNLRHGSVGDSGSYDAGSLSRSTSETGSIVPSLTSNSGMSLSQPSHVSRQSDSDIQKALPLQPPGYTESPVSPMTYNPLPSPTHIVESGIECPVSPINESLDIPIVLPVASRLSVDLPIPVRTPSTRSVAEGESASMPPELPSARVAFTPTNSVRSTPSLTKLKSSSRAMRLGNSFRRKSSSTKESDSQPPLPKEPCFVFSSAGHSLLLWGKGSNYLIRFDVPSNDASAIQGCRYDVNGIVSAAAGNHKCAVVMAVDSSTRKLVIFNGIDVKPKAEIELDLSGRPGDLCLSVSRDDKLVALSLNDEVMVYSVAGSRIRRLNFHHQIKIHETREGVTHDRTIPIGRATSGDTIFTLKDVGRPEPGWFGSQGRGLSSREKAEEQQWHTAIISRKIDFSTDSKELIIATQLSDHCIYIDAWDCTTDPITIIDTHSRSFKMPPWTLNDGDLTSVFYNSTKKAAHVTAFLAKEYPLLIPIPGHGNLQNETYSTKIIQGAQSPTGETFTVANAMTEIIQFEYTARGTLSPRKLRKASSRISQSVFKPGAIALAMPLETVLQMFWVKDGKCMLRSVKMGPVEQTYDHDLRPHYDRLLTLKTKPVIARAPSLMIPELDAT